METTWRRPPTPTASGFCQVGFVSVGFEVEVPLPLTPDPVKSGLGCLHWRLELSNLQLLVVGSLVASLFYAGKPYKT